MESWVFMKEDYSQDVNTSIHLLIQIALHKAIFKFKFKKDILLVMKFYIIIIPF